MIENPIILLGVFPLVGYLIGSTPFAVLIAKRRGVDLRKVGSGNVGATNVARVLGRPLGYLCFFLDVAKGLVPAIGAVLLTRGHEGVPGPLVQASWLGAGFGAILGHVFSFYLGFRGGKGVATALGVVLGIFPYFTYAGLATFAVWIVVTLVSRYISLGSIVAALVFLPMFAAFNWHAASELWPLWVFSVLIVALIIVRHRSNIGRLVRGTESKIGHKS